jgi:hypothetical protein
MIFPQMDRFEFGTKLNRVVSPAQPIRSVEHLFWRTEQLQRIEKALFMTGRHIFIYGDRGVGKSSLAATAAIQWQSSDAEPITVPCSTDASLKSIVATIAYSALKNSRLRKTKLSKRVALEFKYLKMDLSKEITQNDIYSEIHNLNDAVEIIKEAAHIHSERPIVVIDEFDRINPTERAQFGDFIKQLGDQSIEVKIIFTGVGKSLDELLGSHASANRQLDTILLPQLPWEGRFEIVEAAAREFGLKIDHEIVLRIAAVSDGFPSYVHKITEKMLWSVFDDDQVTDEITWKHYHQAINDAVSESYAMFSELYEKVVKQRHDGWEEILWSTADSDFLLRYMKDMYSSYEHIMEQRTGRPLLAYDKYTAKIRGLKSKSCGEVLIPDESNRGLYQYRESMFRGYVRMQAEAHGIELIGKSRDQSTKQIIHVPASANRGYYASKPPTGVHLEKKRSKPKV